MNITKLKKVIQEANPEIMELKFGCEVKSSRLSGDVIKNILVKKFKDEFKEERWRYISFEKDETIEEHFKVGLPINFFTILGRPITLADVLMAIDKNDITKCEQYTKENWTMPEFAGHIVLKLVDIWIKGNNNLDDQSDECRQFLIDLLVKGA